MSYQTGIPNAVAISINNLLDSCAKIEAGQEVLLLDHVDGLYGSDNMVDEAAIAWIKSADPYWMHITGDTRTATLKVGDTLVYDKGYLTALDDPTVIEVAKKYPGRPGLIKSV